MSKRGAHVWETLALHIADTEAAKIKIVWKLNTNVLLIFMAHSVRAGNPTTKQRMTFQP